MRTMSATARTDRAPDETPPRALQRCTGAGRSEEIDVTQAIEAPSHSTTPRRPARPGELCSACGLPAVVVFETGLFGDLPWCGQAEGLTDGPDPAEPARVGHRIAYSA